MTASDTILWLPRCAAIVEDGCRVSLETPAGSIQLGAMSAGMAAALARLCDGVTETTLCEELVRAEGNDALAELYECLHALGRRRLLHLSVTIDGSPLLSLEPTSTRFEPGFHTMDPDRSHSISRFAYLRVERGASIVRSPLGHAHVILHDGRAAALIHALGRPCLAREAAESSGIPLSAALRALSLLKDAAMLLEGDAEDPSLRTWEFHDLLFHTRSRAGRHGGRMGSTYRFLEQVAAPPTERPAFEGAPRIALELPGSGGPDGEPSLWRVLETRRSVRGYGPRPLSLGQLGELLGRSARIQGRSFESVSMPSSRSPLESLRRPFPSAGGLAALELYPIVWSCEGLEAGLHHYDAGAHQLERISGVTPPVRELTEDAARGTGIDPGTVQVLIVITARFPRVLWKYEGMGYAAILKEVGCLLQTLYLVATAMGLAPCAVGSGDSDRFARASGVDGWDEGPVGEFLLGSAPERDHGQPERAP